MNQRKTDLTISFIDRERGAAYMDYEGCSITLIFSKQGNPDIKNLLEDILIGSVINCHICKEEPAKILTVYYKGWHTDIY